MMTIIDINLHENFTTSRGADNYARDIGASKFPTRSPRTHDPMTSHDTPLGRIDGVVAIYLLSSFSHEIRYRNVTNQSSHIQRFLCNML